MEPAARHYPAMRSPSCQRNPIKIGTDGGLTVSEGGSEPPGFQKAISHLNAIDLDRDRTRNLEYRRPALYRLRYRGRSVAVTMVFVIFIITFVSSHYRRLVIIAAVVIVTVIVVPVIVVPAIVVVHIIVVINVKEERNIECNYHRTPVVEGGSKQCFRFSTVNPKIFLDTWLWCGTQCILCPIKDPFKEYKTNFSAASLDNRCNENRKHRLLPSPRLEFDDTGVKHKSLY
ncbi:hypothetical protein ANN_11077 [Periplaneta americana]|uniref:Uncharacterized protein n=1 Tax=Periplaneta americana TaxID=6978 RepID=A0ABQ8T5F4_PERAM|nr:hypothetical protein ANN_11077 [Periplaneta americana]